MDISQLVGGQVTRGWCEEAEAYQCIVMQQIKHHVCYYSSITIAVKQYVYLPCCPCKCPHYTDTSLLHFILCSNRGPPRNGLVHGRFDQNLRTLPAAINTGTVSVHCFVFVVLVFITVRTVNNEYADIPFVLDSKRKYYVFTGAILLFSAVRNTHVLVRVT